MFGTAALAWVSTTKTGNSCPPLKTCLPGNLQRRYGYTPLANGLNGRQLVAGGAVCGFTVSALINNYPLFVCSIATGVRGCHPATAPASTSQLRRYKDIWRLAPRQYQCPNPG